MDQIKLAVDLDNVCADFCKGFIEVLGIEPLRMDIPRLEDMFPHVDPHDLSMVAQSPYTYMNLEPLMGAASNLHWFVEMGVYIEYITARPNSCDDVSRNWLKAHGFPYPDRVVIPEGNKVDYIKAQGFTAAIDDIPDVLNQLFMFVPALYLFDHPWNQGDGPYSRVSSWFEFFKTFRMEVMLNA